MSFKDMVDDDIHSVFLNVGEFAEIRSLIYDGECYANIPVVITELKEQDRNRLTTGLSGTGGSTSGSDTLEGLFRQHRVLHLAQSDIGGRIPEKGMKLALNERTGGEFFRHYTITASGMDMGMIRVEIEMIDE